MKRKVFNKSNIPSQRHGESYIRLNRKAGLISISKEAIIRLDLKPGARIQFIQDEDKPKDWYIEKVEDEDGFKLRFDKPTEANMNNTSICKLIFESIGFSAQSGRMLIGEMDDETELFPIITSSCR